MSGADALVADATTAVPSRTDRLATHGVPVHALWEAPFAPLGDPGPWAASLACAALGALGAFTVGLRHLERVSGALVLTASWSTSAALLKATATGDSPARVALMLLPWALLLLHGALERRTRTRLLGAGACAGLLTLAAPVLLLPMIAYLTTATGAAGRRDTDVLAPLALGLLVVVGFPLAWWMHAREGLVGVHAGLLPGAWQVSDALATDGVVTHTLARPVLVAAAVVTVVRHTRAHTAPSPAMRALIVAGGVGLVLALGPVLPLGAARPLLPWGVLARLPDVAMIRTPELQAAWATLALGVLAAGAVGDRRAALAVVAGLMLEAAVLSPSLPIPVLATEPTPVARALAKTPGTPVLVLPLGGTALREDRSDLLDQLHHGRPLLQGLSDLDDPRAAPAEVLRWRGDGPLATLARCASPAPPNAPADAGPTLRAAGVPEVVLEVARAGRQPAAVKACIDAALPGWTRTEEGPLLRWRAR